MGRSLSFVHASRRASFVVLATACCTALIVAAHAHAQEGYRLPPREIVDIIDAPPPPTVSLDPTGTTLALATYLPMPSIEQLARPMTALAGVRMDAARNGRHNPTRYVGLALVDVATGERREVELPTPGFVSSPSWSPDGTRFGFTHTLPTSIEAWVGDTAGGSVRKLDTAPLNDSLGGAMSWMPDSRHLLLRLVPADRGAAPDAEAPPAGPVIQDTAGRVSMNRTYQDLLEDPEDEALFEHLATSQLALVDVETGALRPLGTPSVYRGTDASPSGRWLLVSRVEHPYSYQVPYYRFPTVTEVWDLSPDADTLVAHEVARLPVQDEVPIGGVATGPRSIDWRDDLIDTPMLTWVEALDDGDPKTEVPHRDRLMAQRAPFDGLPIEVFRTEQRFSGLSWLDGTGQALITDYDRDRRWTRTWIFSPDVPGRPGERRWADAGKEARLVFDRSVNDRYADPGSPMSHRTPQGRSVVTVHDGSIYLRGSGATPEGDHPFLSSLELGTLRVTPLWKSADGAYETVTELLTDDASMLLLSHETPTAPPNWFVAERGGGARRQLTAFVNPAPSMVAVTKELVTYERPDGVALSATLYVPPHEPGERLPLLVWAYPREFNDAATAGQVRGSPYRYTRYSGSSHLLLLTQGYAIMDSATMPIIGDPESMNDGFLEQIVAAAQAAVDEADRRGVADPLRTAVGGHSYGAFMTANLLAHSDIFRAGIARSGAYNRTLTPFGFQSERRTLWEATDTYVEVSPFLHADTINEPILLVHGQDDNNSGTYPIQSERLYHALRGHGATARLVMLPHESHGYRARESILHVHAEQVEWLDKHVKNPEQGPPQP